MIFRHYHVIPQSDGLFSVVEDTPLEGSKVVGSVVFRDLAQPLATQVAETLQEVVWQFCRDNELELPGMEKEVEG